MLVSWKIEYPFDSLITASHHDIVLYLYLKLTPVHPSLCALYCVAEIRIPFNNQRPSGLLLVVSVKLDGHGNRNKDNDDLRRNACIDAWAVVWRILRTEHDTPNDASNASQSHKGRAAKCALPGPSDIIC